MTPLRAGLVILILAAAANSAWSGGLEDAERAYRAGDYAAARQLYAVLAEEGDSHAETNLGLMYANGAGGATRMTSGWVTVAGTASESVIPTIRLNVPSD